MVVEHLHELGCVEELLGPRGGEVLLHVVVVFLLAQPELERDREALLGARCPFVGQNAVGGVAHHLLVPVLVHAEACGNVLGELHDLLVQERDAQLERMRHAHLVGLEQDVTGQPHVHIEILALGQVAEVLHAVVHRCAQLERVGAAGVLGPHDVVDLVGTVHEGLAREPLLGHLRRLEQEVPALEVRLIGHEAPQSATDAARNHALEAGQRRHILIIGVPREQLVGALTGEHDRHLLSRKLGQEPQGDARQVALRLVHVVLNLR